MLMELVDGFYVDPELVAVVKVTGDESCAVFTSGQSATDGGFHVPYSAEQVVDAINDELEPDDDEDDDGDESGDGH